MERALCAADYTPGGLEHGLVAAEVPHMVMLHRARNLLEGLPGRFQRVVKVRLHPSDQFFRRYRSVDGSGGCIEPDHGVARFELAKDGVDVGAGDAGSSS